MSHHKLVACGAVGIAVAMLITVAASPVAAAASPSFTMTPTLGPVGTTITIDGVCPLDNIGDNSGDVIALYRADGAMLDAVTQLGNGQTDPTRWQSTLDVGPTATDGSPTTPGQYEVRLFCEIGSSFRAPDDPDATPRSWADVIQTFTVLAPVERLSGPDRYATAVAIAGQYATGVKALYVATGTNYPDALSAAPAAAAQGGPLLLTAPSALPSIVEAEIRRLAPALIVVVGGPGAISTAVYNKLATLAPAIRRDSGIDRYQTSHAINRAAFPSGASTAFIATGKNFPDALSASAAAGSMGGPVILVNGAAASVDSPTRNLITQLGVASVRIAGGTGVVSAQMETSLRGVSGVTSVARHSGIDRYATSSAISRASFSSAPTVYFAVGTGFADALAGAALAGLNDAPLFVVRTNCVPSYVVTDLQALGTRDRVLLGGSGVLGAGVEALTPCGTT